MSKKKPTRLFLKCWVCAEQHEKSEKMINYVFYEFSKLKALSI